MSSAGPSWTPDQLQADPHADPAKAARVQSMFTAIAPTYDLNNRIHSFGLDQAWRRRTVREVAKRLASQDQRTGGDASKRLKPLFDKKVLDMACGTGDLTELFRKAGALATGGDFTPAMLELARQKSGMQDGQGPRILFVEADATQLPFHTSTFDAVTIAFGLRNVSDPAKAIGEFFRVLRPGGVMAILEFDQPSSRIVRFVHNFYTQRVMPLTATLISRDRSGAYRYLPRSVSTFLTPSGIARLAEAAGFERVEHRSLTLGTCALTLASRPAL